MNLLNAQSPTAGAGPMPGQDDPMSQLMPGMMPPDPGGDSGSLLLQAIKAALARASAAQLGEMGPQGPGGNPLAALLGGAGGGPPGGPMGGPMGGQPMPQLM